MTVPLHQIEFDRASWQKIAKNAPLPLTHADVLRLKALGDPIGLEEADAVYRPLSAILQLEVDQMRRMRAEMSDLLGVQIRATPVIIGISGSVAVGKSTTARLLQALLRRWPRTPSVDLVTTDGFLYSNDELKSMGMLERKGFPESYNVPKLLAFLRQVKSGLPGAIAPLYDHLTYDIIPNQHITINSPEILIIEGLNVLQPTSLWVAAHGGAVSDGGPEESSDIPTPIAEMADVSDFLDFSIYVDADRDDIEQWFIDRNFQLRDKAFSQPDSYFAQYADLSNEEMIELSQQVWDEVNLPNLVDYIEPTRARANVVVHKGCDHRMSSVVIRRP